MTDNMEPTGFNPDADTLSPRELRVVLVCDVVESVRWMEQDEDNAVTRWQAFKQHVRSVIVPAHQGSVVKSTGDGMMIEFPTARGAVQAAVAMHAQAVVDNAKHARALQNTTDQSPAHHLQLRTGIHETQARRDAHDLYGHGVNLAARITTLAGPGEIIVSSSVRDHLTDSIDGDIEDLGECFLKHLSEPQRVYRVGERQNPISFELTAQEIKDMAPALAVMSFTSLSPQTVQWAVGDLIAEGVNVLLSKAKQFKLISRLSLRPFDHDPQRVREAHKLLGVDYALTGTYLALESSPGSKLVVTASLNCLV
jgi:adenylate cyclase